MFLLKSPPISAGFLDNIPPASRLHSSCSFPFPRNEIPQIRMQRGDTCIMSETVFLSSTGKLDRPALALVPTPPGTATHRPVPHIEVVNALVETLGFRHISVINEEYAVDRTGAKMFGVMELDQGMEGARFALGLRNSHDKSFRLSICVGYRVFVCDNLAFHGDYSPVLA